MYTRLKFTSVHTMCVTASDLIMPNDRCHLGGTYPTPLIPARATRLCVLSLLSISETRSERPTNISSLSKGTRKIGSMALCLHRERGTSRGGERDPATAW